MVISPLLVIALVCLAGGGSHLPAVEAIWLTIPRAGDRCVYEEIQANVVVVGDFLCIDQNNEVGLGPTVNIRVCILYLYLNHIFTTIYFIVLRILFYFIIHKMLA